MTDQTAEGATTRPAGLNHDLPIECLFCGGPKHPKVTDCPDYPHYLNPPPLVPAADPKDARIAELEGQLERARAYKGIEAYACPLCTYRNGKFIKPCEMHRQIDELKTLLEQALVGQKVKPSPDSEL